MERRAFFSVVLGAATCSALPALAKPLSCIAVHDYPKPTRLSQIPYSVGGAPTQDAPDLLVETWEHQDKILIVCRWPEQTDAEMSQIMQREFQLLHKHDAEREGWR